MFISFDRAEPAPTGRHVSCVINSAKGFQRPNYPTRGFRGDIELIDDVAPGAKAIEATQPPDIDFVHLVKFGSGVAGPNHQVAGFAPASREVSTINGAGFKGHEVA